MTGREEERAAVVAWLRDGGPEARYSLDLHDADDIASAIERGEDLEHKP